MKKFFINLQSENRILLSCLTDQDIDSVKNALTEYIRSNAYFISSLIVEEWIEKQGYDIYLKFRMSREN